MNDERSKVLPSVPLPTNEIELNDTKITFRSLTRAEAMKINSLRDDLDAVENFILACGVGVSEEEAKAWRENTDPTSAGKLIDGILVLTGLANSPND